MTTYVFDHSLKRMVSKDTGEPMVSGPWKPVAPQVVQDIEPYLSPVSGEYIGGKQAKRDDLAKHNCVDAAELGNKPRKLKNQRFIKKHGLEHLSER